ncbi:MAG: hypothetical protein ACTHXA_09415 [Gulosibacter sp.]|uniref:hypothetical protein n=1 Tax=Gulosibacter sp. TaxID=2817531 RepID=UPI003F937472
MTISTDNPESSMAERLLAYLTVGVAALSFIALFTILLAPLFGVDFASSDLWIWPVSMFIAYWGFPLALILLVAFVLWRVIANRRAQKNR